MPRLDLPQPLNREVSWLIINLLVMLAAQKHEVRVAVDGLLVQAPSPRPALRTSLDMRLFAKYRWIDACRSGGNYLRSADRASPAGLSPNDLAHLLGDSHGWHSARTLWPYRGTGRVPPGRPADGRRLGAGRQRTVGPRRGNCN